jgi:hypothetical protein
MLLEAVEESDMEKLDDCINFLNDLKLLDDWKAHVLLEIKKRFEDVK